MRLGMRWTLAALITLAGAVGGCESNDKDRADDKDFERIARGERRRERSRDRVDSDAPEQVMGRRDRAERADRLDRRSAGMDEIPAGAVVVDKGDKVDLRYEAPATGALYVYDIDDDRVVYVGRVQDRERFVFDPENNRATVDGKTVLRSEFNPRHRYRLYFDRAGR